MYLFPLNNQKKCFSSSILVIEVLCLLTEMSCLLHRMKRCLQRAINWRLFTPMEKSAAHSGRTWKLEDETYAMTWSLCLGELENAGTWLVTPIETPIYPYNKWLKSVTNHFVNWTCGNHQVVILFRYSIFWLTTQAMAAAYFSLNTCHNGDWPSPSGDSKSTPTRESCHAVLCVVQSNETTSRSRFELCKKKKGSGNLAIKETAKQVKYHMVED